MIAIVDYGVGNISAFMYVYKKLGIPAKRAKTAADLADADKIILPGVGSFDHAMSQLEASGMRPMLERKVVEEKVPVIGICVGMQMLAERSEEGKLSGLGWIRGTVRKLDVSKISFQTHLPHMGWNDVECIRKSPLLDGLETDAQFYFLHSYYFECADPAQVLAIANYGSRFACVVNDQNVYGIQCHPEKSHEFGIQLLKNFANL